MIWAGHVARVWMMRNAWNILLGKAEGKKSRERPKRRRGDNIKTDFKEMIREALLH
jgi:hypothetical protein